MQRIENDHVDTLSKLTSSKDSKLLMIVPIEALPTLHSEGKNGNMDRRNAYIDATYSILP